MYEIEIMKVLALALLFLPGFASFLGGFGQLEVTGEADGSGEGVGSVISRQMFEEMLKHRSDLGCPGRFYTYDAFVAAAEAFPSFGNTGSLDTRRRELAAFFGQTSHETRALTSSAVLEAQLLVPPPSAAPEIAPLDTALVRKGQTVRLNLGGGRSVSGVDSPRGLSTMEGVAPSPTPMATMPGAAEVLPPLASIPAPAGELPPPPPLPPGSLPPGIARIDPPAQSGELPRVRGEGQYSHLFSYRGGERPSGSRLPASEVVPARRTSPPLPRRSPLEKGRGSHSGRYHSSHHPPSPRREHTSHRDRSRSPARPGRTTPGSILLGAIGLPLRDYQEKNARAILDLEAEFSQLAVSEPHRRLSSLETRMVKAESFEATMVSMEMFLAMDRRVKQLEHFCELQRQEIAVLRASMGSVGRLQRMDENIRKSDDALAAAMEYNRRARDLGYTGRHAPIADRRGEGPAP